MIIVFQILLHKTLIPLLYRLLRPCYQILQITFKSQEKLADDELDDEDEVFAEFDDERGVVFSPPVYLQRYAAVTDCLMEGYWCGRLEKVLELGYNDGSFLKYLKEVPGVKTILGVDLDAKYLCTENLCDNYSIKKDPLNILMFEGNAADPDYRLIGSDAVVSIEMIEHMLPHDLDRLVHTVFGFIKPWVAIFSTPNGDFNVLFKSMRENGFRRLDHFFEWSREQFNEWSANIVVRYPDYMVACRGIGPGPAGTSHVGCCSQMAIFISKEYRKQQDLSPNSLISCISNARQSQNPNLMMEGWKHNCDVENNVLSSQKKQRSSMAVVIPSPNFRLDPFSDFANSDKTSQCNFDLEVAKNFLMTNSDDELLKFTILVPRRRNDTQVYYFEDTVARLNSTTYTVKSFSKLSREIMEKQKRKSTKESMGETENATETLIESKGTNIWNNINWGDNAPPGCRYYKIVRRLTYPFQDKTEECLILDAMSEAINRLKLKNGLEHNLGVPLRKLMPLVQHITDDEERIKDLLSWSGYEIMGDMVIPMKEDSTRDIDAQSDLDRSDFNSSTDTDWSASNINFDHRSLDRKLRKLRRKLTRDNVDIKLDRVLCFLMKLTLRSKQTKSHPRQQWLQHKLYDLITLTEKAIERKRIADENYMPMLRPGFQVQSYTYQEERQLFRHHNDTTLRRIEDEYGDLVRSADNVKNNDTVKQATGDIIQKHEKLVQCTQVSEIIQEVIDPSYLKSNKSVDIAEEVKLEISHENNAKLFVVDSFKTDETKKPEISQTSNQKTNTVPKFKTKHKVDSSKMMKQVLRQLTKINEQVKEYCGKNKSSEPTKQILACREREKCKTSKPIPDGLKDICETEPIKDETKYKLLTVVEEEEDDIAEQEESDRIARDTEKKIIEKAKNEEIKKNHSESSYQDEMSKSSGSIQSQTSFFNAAMHWQTILIEDINEPSTSKGIRHVINDVQCGSDSVYDLAEQINSDKSGKDFGTSMYDIDDSDTTTVSWTKMQKMGIHIKDSLSSMKTYIKENQDPDDVIDITCGVSKSSELEGIHPNTTIKKSETFRKTSNTLKNKIATKIPKLISTGIKVNDFDTVIQEKEISAVTPLSFKHSIESCGKKKVSSCNIRNFNNKHNIETKETEKNQMFGLDQSKHIFKTYGIRQQVNIAFISTKPDVHPRLSFVGAQVHSYKNSVSEDILYQGMWQKRSIKISPLRKTDYSSVAVNKVTRQRIMRSKMFSKENELSVSQACENPEQTKLVQMNAFQARIEISKTIKGSKRNNDLLNQPTPATASKQYSLKKKIIMDADDTKTNAVIKKYKKLDVKAQFNDINPKEKQKVPQDSNVVKGRLNNNKKHENKNPSINKCSKPIATTNKGPRQVNSQISNKRNNCNKNFESEKNILRKTNIDPKQVHRKKSLTGLAKSFRPKLKDISNKQEERIYKGESKCPVSVLRKYNDENESNNKKIKLPHLTARVEELTKQFLEIPEEESYPEMKYVLFCNEIKHKSSETDISKPKSSTESDIVRSDNQGSERGSSTSSKDSVVTVKPTVVENEQDNVGNMTDIKTKQASGQNFDESPDILNCTGTSQNIVKALFSGRNKNVQMAQIPLENPILHNQSARKSITKTKSSAGSVKPKTMHRISRASQKTESNNLIGSKDITNICRVSQNKSYIIITPEMSPECSIAQQITQGLAVTKKSSQKSPTVSQESSSETVNTSVEKEIVNSSFMLQMNNDNNAKNKENEDAKHKEILEHASKILKEMNSLIEEKFQFMDFILSVHKSVDDVLKQTEGDASETNKDSGNEDPKVVDSLPTDSDGSSLKLSRGSEDLYFADNELSSDHATNSLNVGSVSQIVGRRSDKITIQKPDSPIALSNFSALSMDTQPAIGDQPDSVNLVDSETGSVAGIPRRAMSRECVIVSVSVRSSDSYATCELEGSDDDDDTISVPGWLFHILTQHHQDDEAGNLPPPAERPSRGPPPAAVDVNGNVVEAGAGDGRGIHSDRSWDDSSGNGSSITTSTGVGSNETNSEEWLLVEPLNSTYETLQEPDNASVARLTRNLEDEDDSLRGRAISPPRALPQSSDGDADVSSDVDTDADVNSDVLNNPPDN